MTKADFEGMEFNPYGVFGDTLIYNHYKRLKQVPAFSKLSKFHKELGWRGKNLSNLLGFVIVFIDTQSPLFGERDFVKRKAGAVKAMHIDKESLEWESIEQEDDLFSDMIFEYFKMIHDADYEQWFSFKMQIHDFNKFLRKALTDDPKRITTELNARKALMKEIKNMKEEMQELQASIFDDARLLQMMSKKAVQNSIGGYAEKHAKLPTFHGKG